MSYHLTFQKSALYNTSKEGVTVGVRLTLNGQSVVCDAKIDTGASSCIFERTLGENLGINIEGGLQQRFGTVTGSFLTYGHEVTLSVLDIEFDALVYFADDESFTRNVLGQRGWLDRVRLGIVDYEGRFYLSYYGERA